jgi:diphosphomevalonate decarboxylase
MLHALMMSSDPYFILMKPNTLAIIEKIMDQRKQKQNSFVFTLDAGANVHFLYSKEDENEALSFIQSELIGFCDQGRYICDQVGRGPEKL